MKLSIIGTGYVGLITGVCFAELGNQVVCIDKNPEIISKLNNGVPHFYEPGLAELLKGNLENGHFVASSSYEPILDTDITFICVGTPQSDDGSTNLDQVYLAAQEIGKILKRKREYHLIVVKSTVPIGTTEEVGKIIEKMGVCREKFGIVMNPEFLAQGSAIEDFLNGDRIVIGTETEKDAKMLEGLYSKFRTSVVRTDLRTAEMAKYANNAFLATKISFINEIANSCSIMGVDATQVADIIGMDKRIGRQFLNAGAGWGGSCFGKDLNSLIHQAKKAGVEPKLAQAAVQVNNLQPLQLIAIAEQHGGDMRGRTVSILGLTFKPNTDDIRDAPSIKVIRKLIEKGAKVKAYDPAGMERAKKVLDEVKYCSSIAEALEQSDVCFILTEWDEIRQIQQKDIDGMKKKLVIDGRNVLDKKKFRDIEYFGIGRK